MQNHFERLGLPRRFSIDEAALERAYLAQSRELHPDFHHGSTDAEQLAAITLTSELNAAYKTLKDPYQRAEYLLSLLGGPTPGQEKSQDPMFLMQMMETREQMDELRSAGGSLEGIESELLQQHDDMIANVATLFVNAATLGANELLAIRKLLNNARTYQSLLRDLRGSPDRS
jgi:molecular chaperone HscB